MPGDIVTPGIAVVLRNEVFRGHEKGALGTGALGIERRMSAPGWEELGWGRMPYSSPL